MRKIHVHFHDAGWEENKHPRKDDGKFGSGGGGASAAKPNPKTTPVPGATGGEKPGLTPEKVVSPKTFAEAQEVIARRGEIEAASKPITLSQVDKVRASLDLAKPLAAAHADKPAYDAKLSAIAQAVGGEAKLAGIKAGDRLLEKHIVDFGGDTTQMRDLVRGSVIVNSRKDVDKVLERIGKEFEITRVKDRFAKPTESGYSDMLVNVRLPSGIEGEIQVHIPQMIAAKKLGHKVYDIERKLPEGPEKQKLLQLQQRIYGEALQMAA